MDNIQRWILPNGLTIVAQQTSGIPVACGTLFIRSGSIFETPEQAGLAHLTAELLIQGTAKRSARKIADEIESLGASLGVQSSEDYTELGFSARQEHLERIWDVVLDVLIYPRFPASEIEKERRQALADIKSRHDTIFNLAYDHFASTLFHQHPYGRPTEGALQTIPRFTASQIRRWHAAYFRPDRMVLSFSSGLPLAKVRRLFERSIGHWRPASRVEPGQKSLLSRPLSSQSLVYPSRFEQAYLMTGMQAPGAFQPGFMALKIFNILLGGGMSSRLFLKLREESGLAYEVSSFYPTHPELSQWTIYLGLPAEKVSAAQTLLESMLLDLDGHGVAAPELAQAKKMMRGAFMMEHQTRRRQTWYSGWWEFLGRGYAYDTQYLEDIEAVTREEMHHWIRYLLRQPRLMVKVIPKK